MNQRKMRELLEAKDFRPFRIYVSDHRTYDVYHQDFVWVFATYLLIVTPSPEGGRLGERTEFVSMRHITRIEMLEHAAAKEEK